MEKVFYKMVDCLPYEGPKDIIIGVADKDTFVRKQDEEDEWYESMKAMETFFDDSENLVIQEETDFAIWDYEDKDKYKYITEQEYLDILKAMKQLDNDIKTVNEKYAEVVKW